jgi:hypothetical protein
MSDLFRRDHASWLHAIGALLAILVAFSAIDNDLSIAIQALASALFGVFAAFQVRPIAPSTFGGLIVAAVTIVAYLGWEVSPEQVAAIQAGVAGLIILLTRPQQTPVNSPRPDAVV